MAKLIRRPRGVFRELVCDTWWDSVTTPKGNLKYNSLENDLIMVV